jgi:hypothetical protein
VTQTQQPTEKSNLIWIIAVLFVVAVFVPAFIFKQQYWGKLVFSALDDAWKLVIKKDGAACSVLVLSWLITVLISAQGKWKTEFKTALLKCVISFRVPALVFLFVFAVYLFGVSPYKQQESLARATNEVAKPPVPEIRVDVADKELRQHLTNEVNSQRETNQLLQKELQLARGEADDLRRKLASEQFVALSPANEHNFVTDLREWFSHHPAFTNLTIISDSTEKPRRLWVEQLHRIVAANALPLSVSGGVNMDKGLYDFVIFYAPENQHAAEELAVPFVNLFNRPIMINPNRAGDEAFPLSVRFMGKPFYNANGIVYFAPP